MLKVFADFNARTKDDACFTLHYRDVVLEKQIDDLRLSKGDNVMLYQDEDGFERYARRQLR